MESLEDRRLLAWGTFPQLIGLDDALTQHPNITGAGYSIAILDTGVDYMHPALGGGFGAGKKVVAGWDFVSNDADPMDTDGHGTGVAGAAAALPFTYNGAQYQGIAPGANIIALRTDSGSFNWNREAPYVEQALQWVISHRTQYNIVAVNISNGKGHYTVDTTESPCTDEFATLAAAGVVITSASGNNGIQNGVPGIEYPGAEPSVYSIGAIDQNDVIWSSTERGAMMDLLAPGVNVPLPYWLSPAQNPDSGVNRHIYLAATGTSFAAPAIAGATALLKQFDPSLTGAQIISILKRSGVANYDGDNESSPTTGLTWPRLSVSGALNLGYDERDDALEDNDALGTASALAFSSDQASAASMKLLAGDADFYKFTLGAQSDVGFSLTATGSPVPSWSLFNSGGTLIKNLSAADSARLSAGTYHVRVNAPTATLIGTYTIRVTRAAVSSGAVPGANGTGNGIAYDASGNLHFAWFDEATGSLKYAVRNTSDAWGAISVIDGNPLTGQFVALALDSTGKPGVAYLDSYNADLKYAHWNGSAWDIRVVDANKTTGYYPSLKFDASNRPVITYYYKTSGDLRFALGNSAAGSSWTITTLDSTSDVGRYSSLALNPTTGRWATAYENTTTGQFKYAEQGKSAWAIYVADGNTRYGGGFISLAFNPKTSRPAMSYYDAYNADLKYASFNGSSWSSVAVASKGSVGLYSNLYINAGTGAADILYFSKSSDGAFRANASGASWAFTQTAVSGGRWINRAVTTGGSQTMVLLLGTNLAVMDL